jgi:protocatechuate 3,4-dioxygenase beta subunit
VLTLSLAAHITHAQNDLSGSRQTSVYTYAYRIEPRQALTLFDNNMVGWEKMLHTPIDSFLTGTQEAEDLHLPPADYLFVYANGSQLHASLHSIGPLRYDLLSSGKDAALTLHTPDGQPIDDAIVTVKNRKIMFDAVSNSYPLGASQHIRVGTIAHHDALYYFSIGLSNAYGYSRHPHWWKVPTDFERVVRYRLRGFFMPKPYRSYLVFSKPKYKSGDTVRFKAFIMTSTGRPVKLPLDMRLKENYGKDPDTVITRITPSRPGSYNSSFVLTDSLDLRLDEDYEITLENQHDRPLAEGHFRYEDYALTSLQLLARVDKPVNSPGDPVSLYVKATDENDLPVPDARVRIWAGHSSAAFGFHRPAIFIPDTLWAHDQPLDPIGETRIILPDSIFPPASFRYTIRVELLNSDNEYREKEFEQDYRNDTSRLFIQPQEDSLRIDYRENGRSRSIPSTIRAMDLKGDVISRETISLPVTLQTNPFAAEYKIAVPVGGDSISESWTCQEFHPTLSFSSGRTHDSVAIQVVNPQHLSFWYTIRAGRRTLVQGYGDRLFYQAKAVTPAPYYITLQYRWAGRIQKNEYPLPFREHLLQVQVHQPGFVYPGQKTMIGIDVKDYRGRPVPDADLTAWSYTAKFNNPNIPGGIPYLGKQYRSPIRYSYSLPKQETLEKEADLEWRRWSSAMGLDTIEFYKLLNPDSLYINREAAPDLLTQIAPFVSRKGQPEPIHLLYIDERPVFFSRTNEYPAYSFSVAPGLHSLVLRTATREIRLDTIRISAGVKTFIGINDDTANHAIHTRRMPDTLTPNEREVLRHSLIGLQNTFDNKYVLLSQGRDRNYLVNTGNNYSRPGVFLAGPFSGETSVLREEDGFRQPFGPEGGYRFTISEGLIKEKEWPLSYAFHSPLDPAARIATQLKDRSMTPAIADSLWQDYLDMRSRTMDFFRNDYVPAEGNGALRFSLSEPEYPWMTPTVFVKKVFLFRYDDPDFMRIYAGATRILGYVTPGYYRLFLLLKSQRYLTLDSIVIKPNGLNFVSVPVINIHAADSFSYRISALLKQQEDHWTFTNSPELEPMQSTFNERNIAPASFHRQVNGRVLDVDGHPVPYASVALKGTRYATVTNREGYYQLLTTDRGTLLFSAIGFNTQTIQLREPYTFDVRLHPLTSALNEVVVIGYGVSRKRELTSSVSVVTENSLAGNAAGIQIRGNKTTAPAPLIIVDGLPFSGKVSDLDPNSIATITALTAKDATPIYGSNAGGGAIIITTKTASSAQPASAPQAGNTLRHNFRDDAWWQATLRTDKDGKVSFPVQFPDDITNWNTFVIAATDHRQIGLAEGNIRSFKGLSAGLSVPAFLVEGDSAWVIGKILNYMPDTAVVTRTFSVDSLNIAKGEYRLRTAHLDTFLVHPAIADSLHLRYTLQQPNGYFDGEERRIPIYRAGSTETIGTFSVLEGDTTIHLSFDTTRGPIHVFASASMLPVFLDEIEYLQRYEYGCNEQLASKLLALLEKKRILGLLQKPFKQEDMIKDLIKRLMKARNEGLWGWWPEGEPSAWITLHVTEALQAAEKEGYPTGLDKGPLIAYLVYRLENKSSEWDRLFILQLLQEMQAKVDFKRYIADAENNLDHGDWFETLRLMEVRQTAGMEIRLDTLVAKRSFTALGSCYWGQDKGGLWDNPIQRTLLMYRLLRHAGGYETLLPAIRNYFLEQRGPGHWRNTYESSLILQTLLPDLLKAGAPLTPPSLRLQRMGNPSDVTTFPFETQYPPITALNVHKQGTLPVYFTAWQQYWNNHPEKVVGAFAVHTGFETHGRPITRLTAGEIVTMRIDVDVKGDAEFVMIEAPIPAGCTYYNKTQSYGNHEVHREYFKNKLSIFCGYLPKGTYQFQVLLLPRFTGIYRLNPARAELMYFPVLYGREAMRSVTID